MKNIVFVFGCVFLFVGQLPTAAAQDICQQIEGNAQATPVNKINALFQNGCLGGGNADPAPLTRRVEAVLKRPGKEAADGVSVGERRLATVKALEKVLQILDDQLSQVADDPAQEKYANKLQALRGPLSVAHQRVFEGVEAEGLQNPGHWAFNPNKGCFSKLTLMAREQNPAQGELCLYEGYLKTDCEQAQSEQCQLTYERTKAIVRYATLTQRALQYYTIPILDEHYAKAVRRDKQWDAYFEDARFQYPWELWINGRWLARTDDRPQDAAGNRLGFRRPPNDQWIVLHPNVGLEYVDDAPDGNQLQEAVYIEMFGYNRWSWKPNGDMGTAFGASVIGSYADRADVDDFGWGLMLHYNHTWSLAVVDRGEETGILLSVDLAQLWADIPQLARDKLRFGGLD